MKAGVKASARTSSATARASTSRAAGARSKASRSSGKSSPRTPAAPAPVASPSPATVASTPPAPAAAAPAQHGKVVLGACCTIHEAGALRAHLLEQAALPGPHQIDGSGVQQIDTAGVQLVVSFALDCLERGVHYVWTGRSPALEEAIRTLGVGALLESPGVASFPKGGQ